MLFYFFNFISFFKYYSIFNFDCKDTHSFPFEKKIFPIQIKNVSLHSETNIWDMTHPT